MVPLLGSFAERRKGGVANTKEATPPSRPFRRRGKSTPVQVSVSDVPFARYCSAESTLHEKAANDDSDDSSDGYHTAEESIADHSAAGAPIYIAGAFDRATDAEQDDVAALRELVGREDPKSTDLKLLQFVRARDRSVPAAHAMHTRWLEFRSQYGLDSIKAADVASEVASGKARWHGHDRQRRPACVIMPRLHVPGESTEADTCKFVLYMLEEGVRRADALGQERVCVVYDRRGMSRANFDRKLFSLAKRLVDIVQASLQTRVRGGPAVGGFWAADVPAQRC